MKLHMIIGKKQIVLASLILILGIAVYINWLFASGESDIAVDGKPSDVASSEEEEKNYGDAELVNGSVDDADDFFARARLEKQASRDEAVTTLARMFGDASATSEQVREATGKALETAKMIEDESKVETLIRAKGFSDCVVYLTDETAKVLVKSDGLEQSEAAQIMDIVVSETDLPNGSISIQEVGEKKSDNP